MRFARFGEMISFFAPQARDRQFGAFPAKISREMRRNADQGVT
jgi:hypothetical protein